MNDESYVWLRTQLMLAATEDEHDLELYLDASEAIGTLAETVASQAEEIRALRAENARLQLMERVDY